MTLALIATPKATNANTYSTLAEAETYHEARLHNSDWNDASTGTKNSALVWATRLLDELIEWDGFQVDSDQALRFPRSGIFDYDGNYFDPDLIPTWLKNATAEFAMSLIANDRVKESDLKGFSSVKVASIRLNADKYDNPAFVPPNVWEIIQDYGQRKSQRIKQLTRG
jgi:hypothetical protein